MPQYRYRAKIGATKAVDGVVEAHTEKEAVEKIHAMGYIPIRIGEVTDAKAKEASGAPARRVKRVRSRDITVFSRQLAGLLRAGVPILAAIDIIAGQSESAGIQEILGDVHSSVKAGVTLSSVLERYPRVFPPLFIAMIKTGEDSGHLPETLLRIAEYRTKQEELMSRIRMAMAYPALMAVVGAGTIVFMLTFVMPRLMGLFANMGQSLPLPTRILIGASDALRHWWWAIALVAVSIVFILKRQAGTKTGAMALGLFKLRLPLFGTLHLKASLARFARTMEVLIRSGIPILRAIEVATPVVGNEVLKSHLVRSYRELEQGGSFGKSLKGSTLFPPFMTNLLVVGEESGKLDEALAEVANAYEQETDEAVRMMSSLMEPLMILCMGSILGFMVVAMLLPIFEINVMVR